MLAIRHSTRLAIGWSAVALALTLAWPGDASGIPAFARKYRVTCQLCHNPVPSLTEFGETFAGNGFRFGSEEPPRDTIDTGDQLLDLMKDLPLALRMDIYGRAFINGETSSDIQTPYNVKLLTGGTISRKLSYYLYFFLFERGEVGGIEDAFLYINDVAGAPLDVAIGQFQVSDPMFKRELRLTLADYVVYRTRVGAQPADLTYDRGISGIFSPGQFTITGMVINGNGKGEAGDDRVLDDDPAKNGLVHATASLIQNVRLGAMGYYGRQKGQASPTAPVVRNNVWMLGADATIDYKQLQVNLQYIHREDDNATFTVDEPKIKTDGGFAEAIWRFRGGRGYAIGLWNYVYANAPLLEFRLTGPEAVNRYNALTGGLGYVVRRNVRGTAEATFDFEQEQAQLTLGIMAAF